MDTGCKYDLTTLASVPPALSDHIVKARVPACLNTANGEANCDWVVWQQIGELGEEVDPYILDSTPDVLSIGRRCVESGYEFHWTAYSLAPTLVRPDGHVITLVSRDCCPYLDDHDPGFFNPAAPAVAVDGGWVKWGR